MNYLNAYLRDDYFVGKVNLRSTQKFSKFSLHRKVSAYS